jgi:hypothetical protein
MADMFTANGLSAPASANDDTTPFDSFNYVTATRK